MANQNYIMICLYCDRDKPEKEFSQEHILPQAIGGNLLNNPLSIRNVCNRCNNLSGLFIDGPFIKSWFINNSRADAAKRFCHLTPQTILPLTYFGECDELKYHDKICETWLGPTGDMIYHFHVPYPTDLDVPPLVGIPPTAYKKDIDYGFIFFFVRSNNPEWQPAIINSILSEFDKSIIYFGNGIAPNIPQISTIPDDLIILQQRLKEMSGKTHSNSFKVGINFEARFLCKLALAMGSLVLNESFQKSPSADLLRKAMWEKNPNQRNQLPIRGSGLLGDKSTMSSLDSVFKWPGGHSIALMKLNNAVALYSNFYEANSSVIQITNEPAHWEGKIQHGIIYVISPSLQKAVGPISLPEFIASRTVPELRYEPLIELENEMSQFSTHPPYDI